MKEIISVALATYSCVSQVFPSNGVQLISCISYKITKFVLCQELLHLIPCQIIRSKSQSKQDFFFYWKSQWDFCIKLSVVMSKKMRFWKTFRDTCLGIHMSSFHSCNCRGNAVTARVTLTPLVLAPLIHSLRSLNRGNTSRCVSQKNEATLKTHHVALNLKQMVAN